MSRLSTGILAVLTLLLAVGIGLSLFHKAPAPLPLYGTLPAFSLKTAEGGELRREDLMGRPWVADFIFTRCVGACPVLTGKMRQLQENAPGTRLVSFTVDPIYDTEDVLRRYARTAGAGKEWTFVTGEREALYGLSTRGFHLAAMEVPAGEASPDGPFLHSSRLVLVDGKAQIRGYYDTEVEGTVGRLLGDLLTLAKEK